jgi:hypothetical protein
MANKKISALTAATTSGTGDLFVLVQGGVTKKITYDNLKAAILVTATEGTPGVLEVATTAEAEAGAVDDKIITPLKLAAALGVLGSDSLVNIQWFPATATYTPTSGANKALVFCQGAGGGGAGGGDGGNGGNTTFGAYCTGNGGSGGTTTAGGAGGTATNGIANLTGAAGDNPFAFTASSLNCNMGGEGGAARFLGAPGRGGRSISAAGGAAAANSGSGGGGGASNSSGAPGGGGGGAGGLAIDTVDLTGVSSVSVTIGAAGTAGSGGGSLGGAGYVLVLEYK